VVNPQKRERKNAKPEDDHKYPYPYGRASIVLHTRRQAVSTPSNNKSSMEPKPPHKKKEAGNESKNFMLRGLGIEKEDTGNAKKEEEKTERQ
jgi:hypothetical protein